MNLIEACNQKEFFKIKGTLTNLFYVNRASKILNQCLNFEYVHDKPVPIDEFLYLLTKEFEVVKEKKILSDKINPCGHCDNDLISKDVREAINKFIDLFVLMNNATREEIKNGGVYQGLIEVFGEELLK